ncbi:indole-diterpene biosynthesis protein-like protein PaxU [Trematosphaeria pertusa]|uniref:Indole-diterpene biosynthesis protein-like protein PaxU n=1 Tax=Trematosphaeria pertusa TaxID=390896 RepID=A0A6A6ID02_9PLEO|nr:indole-diterpene biosynthesis protein-like protein PaxU [Trematosphaeria pertusa]KAF2248089.1 indole-diterpene biosynthesis protein-like protein PaxU [Trematosphaeria pertusa]
MATTTPTPSPKFVPLGGSISLYTPSQPTKGRLVILATWLGAAEKHIAKYTTAYTRFIPDSRVLLIQGTMGNLFQHYSVQRRAIHPAVQAIRAVLDESSCEEDGSHTEIRPHILLHVFSNAGANSVANLLHVFHQELGAPLPLVGVICDSSLAKGGYKQNYNGFMRALPDGLLFKILGPPFINLAIAILNTSIALGRYERPEDYWRNSMINEDLIKVGDPQEEGSKRICYFTSKADRTTPWQDVVSHAEMACKNKWSVMLFVYEDTPHCNHMAEHGNEYEEAVRAMWTKSKL